MENNDDNENHKEFKDIGERINDFTTVFNKHNLEYELKMWDSGEGYSILIDEVSIDFFLAGRIEFTTKDGEKNEKSI